MANNKSARKRIETNERNRITNRYYKTSVRTLTKLFLKTLEDQTPESKEKLQTILNSIYSFLDKGTKKNVFHKNTAARQKARLASRLSAVS
uniref:ribosomal protein S20 n=1 Tax=Pseudo-nitzschia delicatissima TaxID=44447 RepID=UPI001D105DA9|nr:ribosomal protein S20 [Pseudo-nitzschia delicatissima]UBA14828.1 ribosomal protein S20 [Pseudo-nitzschia delicatissima]